MEKNLLFYSTNTKIAYMISEKFYNSTHFVWCSPVFNPRKLNQYDFWSNIPGSSSPFKIYKQFLEDVSVPDVHSYLIGNNRTGLKTGAAKMKEKGVIDENDFARIIQMIDTADISLFRPYIYLIPKSLVSNKLVQVDVDIVAHPLSCEYQIHSLKRFEFEIIELD